MRLTYRPKVLKCPTMASYNVCSIAYTNYSADSRVKRESEALAEKNFKVDFIALKRPGEPAVENINGVNVYHLNQTRYRGDSSALYIMSYLVFFVRASFKLFFLHRKKKYRVIHVNNMPDFMVFTTLFPKLTGCRVILDIHDTMPELYASKFDVPVTNIVIRAIKFQEVLSAKYADAVIAVHDLQKNLLGKHGVDESKLHVLMNVADERLFYPREKKDTENKNTFTLIYHGTVAERHGCDRIVKAVGLAKDHIENLVFRIYGEGDAIEDLKKLAAQLGLGDHVWFSDGFIPLEELPQYIVEADVGIASINKDIYTDTMLPVKLIEYISLNIPVITTRTETVEFYFSDSQVLFYDQGDEKSLANALIRLYNDSSLGKELVRNASKFKEKYNWKKQKENYCELVRTLCEGSGRRN